MIKEGERTSSMMDYELNLVLLPGDTFLQTYSKGVLQHTLFYKLGKLRERMSRAM